MRFVIYLSLAAVAYLAADIGADISARTSIGGASVEAAFQDHLQYTSFGSTIFMLAPFVAVAVVCAIAQKYARLRSVALIFAAAMVTLLFFYFQGHHASERAMLDEMWTAATLSVGLLPFFVGVPLLIAVAGAAALAVKFDRKNPS